MLMSKAPTEPTALSTTLLVHIRRKTSGGTVQKNRETGALTHLLRARPLPVGAKGGDEGGAGHDVGLDAPAAPHLVEQHGAAAPVAARGAGTDHRRKGVACAPMSA